MFIKLISKTVCCDEEILSKSEITSEGLIAYITRVSNPSNQANFELQRSFFDIAWIILIGRLSKCLI